MTRAESWQISLTLAGTLALGAALWLADQRGRVAGADVLLGALVLLWFTCWLVAFLWLLRGRDRAREQRALTARAAAAAAAAQAPAPVATGPLTLVTLQPGMTYRVREDFRDCYGQPFRRGEVLRFRARQFLPYHGGHTLQFEERTLYLQEEASAALLQDFARYFAQA